MNRKIVAIVIILSILSVTLISVGILINTNKKNMKYIYVGMEVGQGRKMGDTFEIEGEKWKIEWYIDKEIEEYPELNGSIYREDGKLIATFSGLRGKYVIDTGKDNFYITVDNAHGFINWFIYIYDYLPVK
ncbi:MAG: hypothetical protein JSV09_03480 [Thermoplasmata archaeon]|nr:MAG: hypothetical protein JSV09_03480 [Thermoplasmata archaeon]